MSHGTAPRVHRPRPGRDETWRALVDIERNSDLSVTGRPAQFGRGLGEVGDRLVGQFAQCLSRQLTRAAAQTPAEAGQERVDRVTAASAQSSVGRERKTTEPGPINVLRTAGLPPARRAAVVASGAAVVVLVVVCVRGLRRS
ncbi:hypothetical protein [Streptomyces sp. NPDC003697]